METDQDLITLAPPRYFLGDGMAGMAGPVRGVKHRIYEVREGKPEKLVGEVLACHHIVMHYGKKPSMARHCSACGKWREGVDADFHEACERARAGEGEYLGQCNQTTVFYAEEGIEAGIYGESRRVTVSSTHRVDVCYQWRYFWSVEHLGHRTRKEGGPYPESKEAKLALCRELWLAGQEGLAQCIAAMAGVQLVVEQG